MIYRTFSVFFKYKKSALVKLCESMMKGPALCQTAITVAQENSKQSASFATLLGSYFGDDDISDTPTYAPVVW